MFAVTCRANVSIGKEFAPTYRTEDGLQRISRRGRPVNTSARLESSPDSSGRAACRLITYLPFFFLGAIAP